MVINDLHLTNLLRWWWRLPLRSWLCPSFFQTFLGIHFGQNNKKVETFFTFNKPRWSWRGYIRSQWQIRVGQLTDKRFNLRTRISTLGTVQLSIFSIPTWSCMASSTWRWVVTTIFSRGPSISTTRSEDQPSNNNVIASIWHIEQRWWSRSFWGNQGRIRGSILSGSSTLS